MPPATRLREQLAAARSSGSTFSTAWPVAVAEALAEVEDHEDAAEWQQVLDDTRGAWASAWHREPIEDRPLRALAAVADDPDREPMPEIGRPCRLCCEPIPPDRGRRGAPARYCSDRCRRRASVQRRAAA